VKCEMPFNLRYKCKLYQRSNGISALRKYSANQHCYSIDSGRNIAPLPLRIDCTSFHFPLRDKINCTQEEKFYENVDALFRVLLSATHGINVSREIASQRYIALRNCAHHIRGDPGKEKKKTFV
jgi:hypothetical protein